LGRRSSRCKPSRKTWEQLPTFEVIYKATEQEDRTVWPKAEAGKGLSSKRCLLAVVQANFCKAPWISPLGVVDLQGRDRFFKNPFNRIKGGFNSEKYQKLLSSLDDDINRIVALTSGAIALEPLRLDRKRKASAAYWTQFHQHAERLYEALNSRWGASCSCQCPHEANLRLELRRETEPEHSPTFKLLFFIEKNPTTNSSWYWRAAEVRPSNSVKPA
jgi:hypothetical protein